MTLEQPLIFDLPCWETISPSVKELITLLLKKDPKERISLVEALHHPWFKKVRKQKRSDATKNSQRLL